MNKASSTSYHHSFINKDTIPTWFGDVTTELLSLNASNNQIHGVIPEEFSFSNMQLLDLSRNNISGPINFFCQSEGFWEWIDLSENQFSGHIPTCFKKFVGLRSLDLSNNHFLGEIPNIFGAGYLLVLNLRNNKFTGELPTSLRNCTQLTMMELGENRLKGEIPAWIGDNIPFLWVLVLRSNKFYGSIPASLCNLRDVHVLDFSANNISGVIPKCVSKWTSMMGNARALSWGYTPLLSHSMEMAYLTWKGQEFMYKNQLGLLKLIDLSNNSLHGEIPSEITELDGLIGLNLSTNNLIGCIPPNIGEMKSLDFLDLSRNHLSGSIPRSISGLSLLGKLNLSYNNLSGRIPQDNHALTFEESGFVGNPGLCGIQLNKACSGDEETQNPNPNVDHIAKNMADTNDDDELVTNGFYVAMAIGFVSAFLGVFWMMLNKSTGDALFSKVFKRCY